MSEYQPNPLFAGKTGNCKCRENRARFHGREAPDLRVSLCILSPGSPAAHRTKGLFLVPCNCKHLIASTGLCRFREWCCLCLLQPLTPRVLELPPWFPRLPFSHTGELSYPYLSAVAFNIFFFFNQRSFSTAFSLHWEYIPTQHDQRLSICSFICRTAHRNICFPPHDFFHSPETTTYLCFITFLCFVGKQAHVQLIRGLGGAHLLDSLTVVSAVRAWRGAGTLGLTGFFSSDLTASQYSVSHLKFPLSCYIKVLQLWHATWSVAVSPWTAPLPPPAGRLRQRAFFPALQCFASLSMPISWLRICWRSPRSRDQPLCLPAEPFGETCSV